MHFTSPFHSPVESTGKSSGISEQTGAVRKRGSLSSKSARAGKRGSLYVRWIFRLYEQLFDISIDLQSKRIPGETRESSYFRLADRQSIRPIKSFEKRVKYLSNLTQVCVCDQRMKGLWHNNYHDVPEEKKKRENRIAPLGLHVTRIYFCFTPHLFRYKNKHSNCLLQQKFTISFPR